MKSLTKTKRTETDENQKVTPNILLTFECEWVHCCEAFKSFVIIAPNCSSWTTVSLLTCAPPVCSRTTWTSFKPWNLQVQRLYV